jgi:hypothetical protein
MNIFHSFLLLNAPLALSFYQLPCRYERQLTGRVTELTQRAGDTISHNVELRREIDEVRCARLWQRLLSDLELQIRRNYMTLKAETAGEIHGTPNITRNMFTYLMHSCTCMDDHV